MPGDGKNSPKSIILKEKQNICICILLKHSKILWNEGQWNTFQTTISLQYQKISSQKILNDISNKSKSCSNPQIRQEKISFFFFLGNKDFLVFVFQNKLKRFSLLSGMVGQCCVPSNDCFFSSQKDRRHVSLSSYETILENLQL